MRKKAPGSIRPLPPMSGVAAIFILLSLSLYGCHDHSNEHRPGNNDITLVVYWPDRGTDVDIPRSYEALFISESGEVEKFANLSGKSNVLALKSGIGQLVVYTLPAGMTVDGETAKLSLEDEQVPASPDWFFCWSGRLELTTGTKAQISADMKQQMRELHISISMKPHDFASRVTKVSATLTGVASEINVTDGTPLAGGSASFDFATGGNIATASTRFLGIVSGSNPTLSIAFELSDGKTVNFDEEINYLLGNFNTAKTVPVRITTDVRHKGSEAPGMGMEWRFDDETGYYKDQEVVKLQSATAFGARNSGANIVIMGDGYVQADMSSGSDGKYVADMREAMEHFFSVYPYSKYRDYFNVYMVAAISNEEGMSVANPPSTKDTKFESVWEGPGNTGIETNYETVKKYTGFIEELKTVKRNDLTVILAINFDAVAGTCIMSTGGFSVSMCTTRPEFGEVVVHEACGHGFAKLADEYVNYTREALPKEKKEDVMMWKGLGYFANVDLNGDISKTTWSGFNIPKYTAGGTEKSRVSVFKGAEMYGLDIWRPEYNSCMADNIPYFNAPSRWAAVRRISDLCGLNITFGKYIATEEIPDYPAARAKARAGMPYVPYGHPIYVHD